MEWVGGGTGFGLWREDIWPTRLKGTKKKKNGKERRRHPPVQHHHHPDTTTAVHHRPDAGFYKPGSQTTKRHHDHRLIPLILSELLRLQSRFSAFWTSFSVLVRDIPPHGFAIWRSTSSFFFLSPPHELVGRLLGASFRLGGYRFLLFLAPASTFNASSSPLLGFHSRAVEGAKSPGWGSRISLWE